MWKKGNCSLEVISLAGNKALVKGLKDLCFVLKGSFGLNFVWRKRSCGSRDFSLGLRGKVLFG